MPGVPEKEMIVIWTTSGIKANIASASGPYVVVNRNTNTVVASSDPTLINTKWGRPAPPVGKAGSATIPPPPLPLLIALWRKDPGEAWFTHETAYMNLPPGATVTAGVVPWSVDLIHYVWALTWGDLVDPLVVLTHSHATQMREHDDPLYFSIANFVYPLNLKIEATNPHQVRVSNGAAGFRVFEMTAWTVEATRVGAKKIDNRFKGMDNLLTALGDVTPAEIAKWIRG